MRNVRRVMFVLQYVQWMAWRLNTLLLLTVFRTHNRRRNVCVENGGGDVASFWCKMFE